MQTCRALAFAIYAKGHRLDRQSLSKIATGIGLSEPLDNPSATEQHNAAPDDALEAGVFGVPSFVIGSEVVWGNDRLPLVIDAIKGATS